MTAFHRRLALAAIVAWIALTVLGWILSAPLGYDEAAYAVIARDGDAPWAFYRSPGVVWLARAGLAFGSSELALRSIATLVGMATIGAVWWVARTACDPRVAAWSVAVMVGARQLIFRASELLGDLPAATLLLIAIALIVCELDVQPRTRWRIVWAAPALAAAFYLRYGTSPAIAITAVAAVGLWWRRILARPIPVLATAGLFVLLLVPHVVRSVDQTGHVLGLLRASAEVPHRAYYGEGLVTYLTANPLRFYGLLITPLMLAGLIGLGRPSRARGFVAIVALGQLLAIGIQSHGQARYIFPATLLLTILGVEAVLRLASRIGPRRGAALGLVLVAAGAAHTTMGLVGRRRSAARELAPMVRESLQRRATVRGRPCSELGIETPQPRWYSECEPR